MAMDVAMTDIGAGTTAVTTDATIAVAMASGVAVATGGAGIGGAMAASSAGSIAAITARSVAASARTAKFNEEEENDMKIPTLMAAAMMTLTGIVPAMTAPAAAQRTVVTERTVIRHDGPRYRHRARARTVCTWKHRNHRRVQVCRTVRR